MADFKKSIQLILDNEGGYVNDANDNGGPTNFGISSKFLNSIGNSMSEIEIKNMKKEEAEKYYYDYWWILYHYDQIDSDILASKLFDMAVNMGQSKAIELLQQSYNLLVNMGKIRVDSIMGTETISAINSVKDMNKLISLFKNQCEKHYNSLVKKNQRLSKFLNGWLNRARR